MKNISKYYTIITSVIYLVYTLAMYGIFISFNPLPLNCPSGSFNIYECLDYVKLYKIERIEEVALTITFTFILFVISFFKSKSSSVNHVLNFLRIILLIYISIGLLNIVWDFFNYYLNISKCKIIVFSAIIFAIFIFLFHKFLKEKLKNIDLIVNILKIIFYLYFLISLAILTLSLNPNRNLSGGQTNGSTYVDEDGNLMVTIE